MYVQGKSMWVRTIHDWIIWLYILLPVGIESCRFARECISFMHACVYLPS